jgi:hypothetical protein
MLGGPDRTSRKTYPRGWPGHIELLEARVLLSSSPAVQLPLLATAAATDVSGTPQGLSPAMIEQAYDLKNIVYTTAGKTVSANGAGETIAIVDAFGDPDIESDLQTFDANFGISNDNASGQFALTVATPQGAVQTNAGWATEESLDVEWAHAIAPEANILLVEAPSTSMTSLTNAAIWAASQPGVVAVSMSWGDSPEFAGELAYDKDFTTPASHAGVTFLAASGDDAAPNYPSTSPNVLAVGGTTLNVDGSGDWLSESAWADSGGGTSIYEGTHKPDVAYDGDPSTGFLIYDSLPYQGQSGWLVYGGTSAGTPQWAAIVALADQGRSLLSLNSLDGATQTISDLYALPSSDFNPVSAGGLTGLGSPVGEKIISALVGGGITSVGSSSNPSPSAAQLAFVQQPTNVTAGGAITPAVTVDVEDSGGNLVTSDNSTVTISVAGGSVTLDGTLTVAAVNGVATFNNLSLDLAGSYTLTASDGSLAGATSSSFTVNPAATSKLVYVQEPSNISVGSAVSPSIILDLEDQFGNIATSDDSNVTLSVASGQGGVTGTATVAASNGVATFSDVILDAAGSYTLTATDGGLTPATSASFTVLPAAAAKLAYFVQPSDVIAGIVESPYITVDVEDQFGDLVSNDSSDVTLSIASGRGGLGGTLTVAAVNGVATFSNVSITAAGAYTLEATDGNLTSATSGSFTVTAAAASQLIFAQPPNNAVAGDTISPGIAVEVEDQFGNVVSDGASSITLTVATGPGNLSGTTTLSTFNGVAIFSDLSITTSGTYTLQASDGDNAEVTSDSFIISPAAAAKLGYAVQPSDTTAGVPPKPTIVLDVEDQFGNIDSSDSSTVTLAVAGGPGSLSGATSVSAIDGVAAFGDMTLDTAGTYTLTASDGSLSSATSSSFTVSPAAAAQLVFAAQPSNVAAGVAESPSIVVNVEDQFGNPVPTDSSNVTLSVGSGPGPLTGAVTIAASGGVATFSGVTLDVAGNYELRAGDGNLNSATSNPFVVSSTGIVTKLVVAHQQTAATKNGDAAISLTLLAEDQFGNVVNDNNSTASANLTSPSSASALVGSLPVPVIDGTAQMNFALPSDRGTYSLSLTDGSAAETTTFQLRVVPLAWQWWFDSDIVASSNSATISQSDASAITAAASVSDSSSSPLAPVIAEFAASPPSGDLSEMPKTSDSGGATDVLAPLNSLVDKKLRPLLDAI